MNPLDILSWVAAVCGSIVLISFTFGVVVATIHGKPKRRAAKNIYRGGDGT